MCAFGKVASNFVPLVDAVRTMYATEASFVISSNKKTPGVSVKLKVNEIDEQGQPQADAGRIIFNTFWLSDNAVGMYSDWLQSLGFQTDNDGDFLLPDGRKMPDPRVDLKPDGQPYENGDVMPFLVGIPFVAKTVHSVNVYDKGDGSPKQERDQYRLKYNYVGQGVERTIQTSVHPRKTLAFGAGTPAPAPIPDGGHNNPMGGFPSGGSGFPSM